MHKRSSSVHTDTNKNVVFLCIHVLLAWPQYLICCKFKICFFFSSWCLSVKTCSAVGKKNMYTSIFPSNRLFSEAIGFRWLFKSTSRLRVEQKEKSHKNIVSSKISFHGSFFWWENRPKMPIDYVSIT